MSATKFNSILNSLEIDSARVEALSEPDLCELIGFIEDDSYWHPACDESPPAAHMAGTRPPGAGSPHVRPSADVSWRE
jgi:hypothetical protein